MKPVQPVYINIYQSNSYRKDLSWIHFDDESRAQETQQVKEQHAQFGTTSSHLDETHLDAVRGLILLTDFRPVHQQVELVRAMRLRSTKTNRSAYCLCQGLDSKLKNLD